MSHDPEAELAEAWALLSPLFLSRRDQFFASLAELGLTPAHGLGLMSLSGGPVRMRDLAESMKCDASYITLVVDRLQHLGLASRQESTSDRRVREVVLTARGRKVVHRLQAKFAAPPDELRVLSATDRAVLVRILHKLPKGEPRTWITPTRAR